MVRNILKSTASAARTTASFFVPISHAFDKNATVINRKKRITAVIPTYKPDRVTLKLIKDLLALSENIQVIVVDDSTPEDAKASIRILFQMTKIAKENHRLVLLQTTYNHLKAAALNVGLYYIQNQKVKPNVVITFDDDVVIAKDTVRAMVKALYSHPKLGTVCTRAYVKNKNKNILTRLQNFEYHGFNLTKIGDNGFLQGPLVMQGMLSAFRYAALSKMWFKTDGLIEDYEMTVKIKKSGWHAGIAPEAFAWTYVPEKWGDLWRQRVRWSYGGLTVMADNWKYGRAIFQDIVGHGLFMSLFILVVLSFVFRKVNDAPVALVNALFILAIFHFICSLTLTFLMLFMYPQKDRTDYLLKFSILPEFIYSNVLSAIVLGSYLFFAFNALSRKIDDVLKINIQKGGHVVFNRLGYTVAWGTRI